MKTFTPKSSVRNSARLSRWVAPVAVAILGGSVFAQYAQPDYVPSPQTAAPVYVPSPTYHLTEEQVDGLTGLIALYPDPLIAEILPPATYPADVQSAAAFVRSHVMPAQATRDAQP